ncbi:MAG: SMC family ATPase [Sumerlaeia bacterium]
MKPITTRLENFGPHRETTVRWNDGVSVIQAANGSGKTFLLEGDFACLFGRFPSYPGTLYDNITQGASEAALETHFELAGTAYRARREVKLSDGGNTSQKATLWRGDEVIAGPKVRDFEAALLPLVGDQTIALATWFCSQTAAGDLAFASPAERRTIFGELLSFADLNKWSEACREKASKESALADDMEARAAGAQDFEAAIAERQEALMAAGEGLDRLRLSLREREKNASTLGAKEQDLQVKLRALGGAQEKHDAARRESALADEALAEAERRLGEFKAAAARGEQAKPKLERLREIQRRLPDLRAKSAAHAAHERWRHRYESAVQRETSARRSASQYREATGVDEETRRLGETVEAEREDYRRAKRHNDALQAEATEVKALIAKMHDRRSQLDREAAKLEAEIAGRPETPFGEKCSPCGFLRRWSEQLPAALRDNRTEAEKVAAALQDAEGRKAQLAAPIDLDELIARGQRAAAAAEKVKTANAAEGKARALELEADQIAAELAKIKAEEPPAGHDCGAEVDLLTDEAARLASAEAEVEAGAKAQADMAGQGAKVAERQAAAKQARASLEQAQAEAEETEKLQTGLRTEINLVAESRRREEAAAAELTRDIEEKVAEKARIESAIAELRRRWEENRELAEAAREKRQLAEDLRTLQTAFGPKGVQPILIDLTAPQLESIADRLLAKFTGGTMRLRIATQSAGRDGRLRPDFQILIRDEAGERDILAHSGGEKTLLRIVLRLSIAHWLSFMGAPRSDTLRFDEPFDALDGDRALEMVELLREITTEVSRVIVVSHDAELARQFPGRVLLRKGASGVHVVQKF